MPPKAAHVSEDIGYVGFFADIEQQEKPPKEELEKLLPGNDSSVKVKASLLIIAQAIQGRVVTTYMLISSSNLHTTPKCCHNVSHCMTG